MDQAETSSDLANFVESFVGEGHMRVEADLGFGYVRLRLTEAESRQAIQDIRSSEDILIELLRNARDAQAKQIFVALARNGSARKIVVIDDGCGIPQELHGAIFEPRVTSKLDTGHLDKWGFHGRGMALFSIASNAESAEVCMSSPQKGTAIAIETDLQKLAEKTDQSSFPQFVLASSDTISLRGPKNLLRTAAEFSLEARECAVYLGSFAEIAATMRALGEARRPLRERLFRRDDPQLMLWEGLSVPQTPEKLAQASKELGMEISERTARRIIDGEIAPVPAILTQIKAALSPCRGDSDARLMASDGSAVFAGDKTAKGSAASKPTGKLRRGRKIALTTADREEFSRSVKQAFVELAQRYYLSSAVDVEVHVSRDALTVSIPLVGDEGELTS